MKKWLNVSLTLLLLFVLLTPCVLATGAGVDEYGNNPLPEGYELPDSSADILVYDAAGLLTEYEAQSLQSTLSSVSSRHNADIVVVTIDSLSEYNYTYPEEFADDFFDYNGFGRGSARSGVLLLLVMDSRDWYISTRGTGIGAFTDYGIQWVGDNMLGDLKNRDYASAFSTFASNADYLYNRLEEGNPLDVDSDREPPKAFSSVRVIGSLIAGLVGSLIPMGKMKNELKTVRSQPKADVYALQNTLQVNLANDMFIGRHVSRTRRETERSSGGSSTHTSHSGASHGGGGGKF